MQLSFALLLLRIALSEAHSIFQRVSVSDVDQGLLVGIRAPDSNNPITDVTTTSLSCNTGLTHLSSSIITIPAGAKVGVDWGHVIGGAQYAGDTDNPIASSHKGPIMIYLAKVDNAATSGTTGLSWFKVAQETLNNGVWGVDSMIAGGGWWYFTMPTCVPSGNYLMRAEIVALHNAYSTGGAQFYMECAQISITGGGTASPATVSFPGVYSASDPGILINIYDSNGQPTNGGKAYSAPGPNPIVCSGGSTTPTTSSTTSGTTLTTTSVNSSSSTKTSSTTTPTTTSSSGAVAKYGQCGGSGYTGSTTCVAGTTCQVLNTFYSQCI